jgi:mannosylglycerate hydrolase
VDEESRALPFAVIASEIMDPGPIDRQIVHSGNYDPFIQYTVQFRDRLPAMGYKTYFVVADDRPMTGSDVAMEAVETDCYRIAVNPNGTLRIFDKQLNREFDQVLLIENGGDDGDEYDYSPLPGETLLYSDQVRAEVAIRQTAYAAEIDIQYRLPVPGDLEQRKARVIDSAVAVHVTVSVPRHKPVLAVRFAIRNRARDHRLRALIPTGNTGMSAPTPSTPCSALWGCPTTSMASAC